MDCQYNHKLLLVYVLVKIRSRRTFDRRLQTISTGIKERISTMGCLFVLEEIVDPYILFSMFLKSTLILIVNEDHILLKCHPY